MWVNVNSQSNSLFFFNENAYFEYRSVLQFLYEPVDCEKRLSNFASKINRLRTY